MTLVAGAHIERKPTAEDVGNEPTDPLAKKAVVAEEISGRLHDRGIGMTGAHVIVRSAAFDEMLRIIREEEPPRPSMRLSTIDTLPSVAANRRIEPQKLRTLVRGELDWIVMKALEKDRARRYETANGFAADIQHYLADEPVMACPPSVGYRFRKFARRNKALLATVSMIALALVLGMVGTSWQAHRATRAEIAADLERDTAKRERNKAELLADEKTQLAEETRRLLYVADMSVALQEWAEGNVERVVKLLRRHQPQEGEQDLRRFEWYHLWQLCQRSLQAPTLEHDYQVVTVAFSPDGRKLAGANKNLVTIWDVETLAKTSFHSHADFRVYDVSFSLDGRRIASANLDKPVKVWNIETGEQERTIVHDDAVFCVEFSPVDSTLLAFGSKDGKVTFWNVEADELLHVFQGHDGLVKSLAFSSDGRLLASGSYDETVRLWDVVSRRKLDEFSASAQVHTVDFSPDDKTVAVRSPGQIALWEVEKSKSQVLTKLIPGEFREPVTFSPDGKVLASNGSANTVKLWDAMTGDELSTIPGHSAHVNSVAFSPNGAVLASSSMDGTVRLWDLSLANERTTVKGHRGRVWSLSFSPDGQRLASANRDGAVQLWDTRTWSLLDTIARPDALCVAFSPDGKTLAYSGGGGSLGNPLELWHVEIGQPQGSLTGHRDLTWTVAFSPDERYLASGDEMGAVRFWDRINGREMETPLEHNRPVRSVVFSPDSAILASSSSDSTVKLWDVATRTVLHSLTGHTQNVWTVAFSADGKLLASAGNDRTVRLWDVETGTKRATLTGVSGSIWDLAFSPDGTTLASASGRRVTLWDVEGQEERAQLRGHSILLSVAFSPDGRTLVGGVNDGTLMLWHAADPEEVRRAGW